MIVIPGRAPARTSDVQLHIGESRDSGFDASHRPGMTNYFSLIGAAIFSAGAGGSAGVAPAFCASVFGLAGCGGISVGRWPVVTGSAGADGLFSPPGVDCNGGVACAICCG